MTAAVDRAAPAVAVHPVTAQDSILINGVLRTMLTPGEVATLWDVSVRTIYRMIRIGRLPVLNLAPGSRGGSGDRYRIAYRAVRELEASRDEPVPAGE